MTIDAVVGIFLGWVLGLLSPLIVDAIRKHCRQREVQQGIFTELRHLRLRMALAAYAVESHLGTIDRALLKWMISTLENYRGETEPDRLLVHMRKCVALGDDQLLAVLANKKAQPGSGLDMAKYRVPYLDSRMGQLEIFDEQTRAAMLDVRAQLDFFNEEIDEARLYHKMTFEFSASDTNYPIVRQNVENCYRNLGRRAKQIADRIGTILSR
jgi:hypothetical protein